MFQPLKQMFRSIIVEGNLAVRDARGDVHQFGDGTGPGIAIHITDHRVEWAFVRAPELAAGEAYMDGTLVMETGCVYDFMELAFRNMAARPLPSWARAFARLRQIRRRWDENNPEARSAYNAAFHYDVDPRIYDLFLDRDRQYSCAYFAPGATTLEEAQEAKKRHIAAKLRLHEGLDILDIGCGWGGLARYLAEVSGACVKGITLSPAQLHAAFAHMPPAHGRTAFAYEDYRTTRGAYDRIVSVGMFEHVGSANYTTFFQTLAKLLKDDGIALIHSIGRLDGPSATNPFVAKWIFPGGALPALSEVTAAVEASGLIMTDTEILRLHYAETLRAWRQRFLAHRAEATEIAGIRFVRMWEFYLAGCEAAFRYQLLMVFQIQLAKRIDTLPLTRDYMIEAERRLVSGAVLRPILPSPLHAGHATRRQDPGRGSS